MNIFHVAAQILGIAECTATNLAAVRLLTRVNPLMDGQSGPRGKRLSTDVTLERTLARMTVTMLRQRLQPLKCSLTVLAFVHLDAGMFVVLMAPVAIHGGQFHVANLARNTVGAVVHIFLMPLQQIRRRECLLANIAFEFLRFCVLIRMGFQEVSCCKGPITFHALVNIFGLFIQFQVHLFDVFL